MIPRRNQMRGGRILNAIDSMRPQEEMTAARLLEIATEQEARRAVRQHASLTPLRNSSAGNAEAAFAANGRRGRLALNKSAGPNARCTFDTCSTSARHDTADHLAGPSQEQGSLRLTAGAIRASATINDSFEIPDCTSDDMAALSNFF